MNLENSFVFDEDDEIVETVRPIEQVVEASEMFDDMLWLGRHLAIKDGFLERYLNSGDETKIGIAKGAMKAEHDIIEKYKNEKLFNDYMSGKEHWSRLLGIVETLRWVLGDEWGMLDS